jgi:hypothetical protein
MSDFAWRALLILTTVAVVVEAIVIVGILRSLGTVLLQVGPMRYGDVEEGPEPGTLVDVEMLKTPPPAMILFMGPTCELCSPVAAALPAVRNSYPDLHVVAVVVGDDENAKRDYAGKLKATSRTDLDHLFQEWKIPGTPYVVGVGRDGKVIASGIANNLPQLEDLALTLLEIDEEGTISGDTSGDGELQQRMTTLAVGEQDGGRGA